MKLFSLNFNVDYCTVHIYDLAYNLDETFEIFCQFSKVHGNQGFRGFPGAFAFFIMTDAAPLYMEVMLDEEVCFDANTLYAIQVPFNVISDQGVTIENVYGITEDIEAFGKLIHIPRGHYVLVFEQGYLNEQQINDYKLSKHFEECKSSEYYAPEIYDEAFFKSLQWCRIWFNAATDDVEAKVLIQKPEAIPYFSVNPNSPLVLDLPPHS